MDTEAPVKIEWQGEHHISDAQSGKRVYIRRDVAIDPKDPERKTKPSACFPLASHVRQLWPAVHERINALKIVKETTIADYPIGRSDRGLCLLEVEFRTGHGWRPVKTTTNKLGRWCKPHAGTYRRFPMAVVEGEAGTVGRFAQGWLSIDIEGVWLQTASGTGGECLIQWASSPFGDKESEPGFRDAWGLWASEIKGLVLAVNTKLREIGVMPPAKHQTGSLDVQEAS